MESNKKLELLSKARTEYTEDLQAMADIHVAMEEDLEFINGDMWPGEIVADRKSSSRPCLTVNRLIGTVNQVANDHRQNRPRGKVSPVDESIDKDTAEVVNGLLYHIQNNSDASIAFDTAEDFAISCSVGYFRISTDYIDDDSFDQEIKIGRIDNPFAVLFPVHRCHEADWSDADHCFVIKKISTKEYEKQYDDNPQNWSSEALADISWISDDQVTLAEYFSVTTKKAKRYQLEDGTVVDKVPDGLAAVAEREVDEREVKWYLLSGGKILEEKVWPAKWIPIIPVTGREINIKGKKYYISLVRFAKDPQRNYNYMISAQTERVALAPLAPFVGAEGQFSGYEATWAQANRKTMPYLQYKPVTINGTLAPAPQRAQPVQADSGLIELRREAAEDIKVTTSTFDASLGNKGNETSGIAIRERKNEGGIANFHFADNLNRAIRHATRIIVDLIPKIIDTPRAIRILGDDMASKIVRVNQAYLDPKTGKDTLYDLTAGKYDVIVSTGPSYNTRRQESASMLTELVRANPQMAMDTSDLLARFLDMPDEIVQRLKKTLRPGLAEDEESKDDKMSEGEVKQLVADMQKLMAENQMSKEQMQKMDMIIQKLEAEAMAKESDNRTKLEVAQINGEAKVATEVIKAQNNKAITGMKINAEQAMAIASAIQNIVSGGGTPENVEGAGE